MSESDPTATNIQRRTPCKSERIELEYGAEDALNWRNKQHSKGVGKYNDIHT
jgi:hypothetical protein